MIFLCVCKVWGSHWSQEILHTGLWQNSDSDFVKNVDYFTSMGFPVGSNGRKSAFNEEDPDSAPRSGKSTGEGNGNPP